MTTSTKDPSATRLGLTSYTNEELGRDEWSSIATCSLTDPGPDPTYDPDPMPDFDDEATRDAWP